MGLAALELKKVETMDIQWTTPRPPTLEWSPGLRSALERLTAQQRRAITLIIAGELRGVALTRFLHTPYSCPHCGLACGRAGQAGADRKAERARHIITCPQKSSDWQFAVGSAAYYRQGGWASDPLWVDCLSQARAEAASGVLTEAAHILKGAAPEAALELRRQVSEGERDNDRRLASVAILNMASPETAEKVVIDPGSAISKALERIYGNHSDG